MGVKEAIAVNQGATEENKNEVTPPVKDSTESGKQRSRGEKRRGTFQQPNRQRTRAKTNEIASRRIRLFDTKLKRVSSQSGKMGLCKVPFLRFLKEMMHQEQTPL